ncbi:hypothetical protein [Phenylobacterium sp.]|uniref:hypothetical protein n=1 Tax=Phenylobacterium sp. TaxID=1871053 RepID=UPI0035AE529B
MQASTKPKIDPRLLEPTVQVRTETRIVCPVELEAAAPNKPALPAGATLVGDEYGLGYAGARFAREDALDQLIADARKACAAPQGAPAAPAKPPAGR